MLFLCVLEHGRSKCNQFIAKTGHFPSMSQAHLHCTTGQKVHVSFTEGVSNLWCVRKSCRTFIKFPRIFNGTLKFEFRVLIASSIVLFLLLQILSLMFNTKASQTSTLLCQSRWCRCSSSFRPWSQLNSIKTFSWRVKVDWNVIFCSHLVLAQNLPQNLHTKIQEFFGFPTYSHWLLFHPLLHFCLVSCLEGQQIEQLLCRYTFSTVTRYSMLPKLSKEIFPTDSIETVIKNLWQTNWQQ